jgi:Mn2+/Fe2+ NRAMP family transporter
MSAEVKYDLTRPHSSILLPWLIGLINEHLHKKACPKSTFSLSKFNFFRETFITFFALISNSAFIVFFSYVRLLNTVQYTLGLFHFNFVKLCLMFCCVKKCTESNTSNPTKLMHMAQISF